MRCFAKDGYSGARTRTIAASAGVTLPVIAYHFGNKEGLHRACAAEILERYRLRMLDLVTSARSAAHGGALSATDAQALQNQVLGGLVDALTTDEEERLHTRFIMRELGEHGPAYDILYRELWRPGISLVADLLAISCGRLRAQERDKANALLLLSSLTAFTTRAAISMPILGWTQFDKDHRALIKSALQQMAAGLLAGDAEGAGTRHDIIRSGGDSHASP